MMLKHFSLKLRQVEGAIKCFFVYFMHMQVLEATTEDHEKVNGS